MTGFGYHRFAALDAEDVQAQVGQQPAVPAGAAAKLKHSANGRKPVIQHPGHIFSLPGVVLVLVEEVVISAVKIEHRIAHKLVRDREISMVPDAVR